MVLFEELTTSQCQVNKYYRLYNNIRNRITALNYQYQLQDKRNNITPTTTIKYKKTINLLTKLIDKINTTEILNHEAEYKRIVRTYNRLPKTIKEHCNILYGGHIKYQADENEHYIIKEYKKRLKQQAIHARKKELMCRLTYEILTRQKDEWYMIFDTLTVNDQYMTEVFENPKTWHNYIRSIESAIGIKLHGTYRKAHAEKQNGNLFHTYFAVTEFGKKTGRQHIHVLHFCKTLPVGCYDPNAGHANQTNREITYLKSYWKYGHSTPIAIRTHNQDAYGKNLKWRFPNEIKNGIKTPLKTTTGIQVANYIGKYINKNYLTERKTKWRTKLSRQLGKTIITKTIQNLNQENLGAMVMYQSNKRIKIANKTIPTTLIKKIATREWIERMRQSDTNDIWRWLTLIKPRENILKRLKNTILTTQQFKRLKCGITWTTNIIASVASNLIKIFKNMEQKYFAQPTKTYETYGNPIYTGAY